MENKVVKGILVDKARFKDNSLIINVLSDSGELISGIYFLKKDSSSLDYLFLYEFVCSGASGRTRIESCRRINTVSINQLSFDQYYLISELVKQVAKIAGNDFFEWLQIRTQYFYGEYRPSFHLEFITDLIDHLGYLPELFSNALYFDLRQGIPVNDLPGHSDYCHSELILPALCFPNDNSSFLRISDSRSRAELFLILIRFLEIQKGIKITLKSIDVLRDLR